MERPAEGYVARAMLRDAVASQSETFDRRAIERWFRRHASWVDPVLIDGLITAGTVNDRGRQHIPRPDDLLFGRADGRFERYDPLRHGFWSKLGVPQTAADREAAFGPPAVGLRSPRDRFSERVHHEVGSILGTDLGSGEMWLRGGVRQGFDLVSADGRIVGHSLWIADPELGWARLTEAVWLLQQVPGATRLLVVVGGDRDVAERWLAERAPLAYGVDVYFFGEGGVVDLKAEARRRWRHRPAV